MWEIIGKIGLIVMVTSLGLAAIAVALKPEPKQEDDHDRPAVMFEDRGE